MKVSKKVREVQAQVIRRAKDPKQQFKKGDIVKIADDLGPSMRHFISGKVAVVVGSYYDQYGRGDKDSRKIYTLNIPGRGESSWYDEQQLTLIERA